MLVWLHFLGTSRNAVKNVHIDSVDGGASLGTRCVAWPSSVSFSDGDTSDNDSDNDGLVSAGSDSNGRDVVTLPSDDVTNVTAAAGEDSNNSTNKQIRSHVTRQRDIVISMHNMDELLLILIVIVMWLTNWKCKINLKSSKFQRQMRGCHFTRKLPVEVQKENQL